MLRLPLPSWLIRMLSSEPLVSYAAYSEMASRFARASVDGDEWKRRAEAAERERDDARAAMTVGIGDITSISTALLTAYRSHSEAAIAAIDHHSVCDKCSARPGPHPCADVIELAMAERRARFAIGEVTRGGEETPNA